MFAMTRTGRLFMTGLWMAVAALATAAAGGCGRAESATVRETAFAADGFTKAKVSADASGRLLVVDVTAAWCKPCQVMETTTWADDRVASWLDEHAVAVQVNFDQDRKRAMDLRAYRLPAVIVFKSGRELGRVTGYQSPDRLLRWLEDLRPGGQG